MDYRTDLAIEAAEGIASLTAEDVDKEEFSRGPARMSQCF